MVAKECPYCGKRPFFSDLNFEAHIIQHERVAASGGGYHCCNAIFVTLDDYLEHVGSEIHRTKRRRITVINFQFISNIQRVHRTK